MLAENGEREKIGMKWVTRGTHTQGDNARVSRCGCLSATRARNARAPHSGMDLVSWLRVLIFSYREGEREGKIESNREREGKRGKTRMGKSEVRGIR